MVLALSGELEEKEVLCVCAEEKEEECALVSVQSRSGSGAWNDGGLGCW